MKMIKKRKTKLPKMKIGCVIFRTMLSISKAKTGKTKVLPLGKTIMKNNKNNNKLLCNIFVFVTVVDQNKKWFEKLNCDLF